MAGKRKTKTRQKPTTQRAPANRWDKAFLSSLRRYGIVTAACEAAKVDRSTVYDRRDRDAAFAVAWDEALEMASDRLELEARRRAERGVLKPIHYKGARIGYMREYSDTLMALMLKASKPDKFGDKMTIRIDPEQAVLLKKYGLTPSEAFQLMMEELASGERD